MLPRVAIPSGLAGAVFTEEERSSSCTSQRDASSSKAGVAIRSKLGLAPTLGLCVRSKGVTVKGRRKTERQRDAEGRAAHAPGGVFLLLSHARRELRGQLFCTL